MVKANAYGHSLTITAPALYDEGCRKFAITDCEEGAALRSIIGSDTIITVLSGIFDARDAQLAVIHHLTPTITELGQLQLLKAAGFSGHVWLKVDTGMQRLGSENIPALFQACLHSGIGITGVMSHLACADKPKHTANLQQVEQFRSVMQDLPAGTGASLLNSAGIAAMPEYGFDVVRPGIALYGSEPTNGIVLGLKPVMRLIGSVMQIRRISKSTTVSYGATYTANRDTRIAVISLGYADGLPRALSNRGFGIWQGKQLPVLGRICMDYCILDVGEHPIQTGNAIEFWGEELLANDVASSINTISYELFTQVGARVNRIAVP